MTSLVESGTYVPTGTSGANVAALAITDAIWMRENNRVTVTGSFQFTPTSAETASTLDLSLPVASNIGSVENIGGGGAATNVANYGTLVQGNVSADEARFSFTSDTSAGQVTFRYIYMYGVV